MSKPYSPWYERARLWQLCLYGALALIVVKLMMNHGHINIMMDAQEWRGLRPFAVMGELLGSAIVGAAGGAALRFYLLRKTKVR